MQLFDRMLPSTVISLAVEQTDSQFSTSLQHSALHNFVPHVQMHSVTGATHHMQGKMFCQQLPEFYHQIIESHHCELNHAGAHACT